MSKCIELFTSNSNVQFILNETISKCNVLVENSTDDINCLLTAAIFKNNSSRIVFYVASNVYKATLCYDKIGKIIGYENINLYAIDEVVASEVDATSSEFKSERINTIKSILSDEHKVVVTHINAVLRDLIPSKTFIDNVISINEGCTIDSKQLIKSLISMGYHKSPTTNVVGDFSVRGGVIDIYPINCIKPVRLDLFDDEVEKIKYFDSNTQKSIKDEVLKSVEIYPNCELIYNNPDEVISKINADVKTNSLLNEINKDLEDIKNYNISEKMHKYLYYMTDNCENIFDYSKDKICLFDDVNELSDNYEKTIIEFTNFMMNKEANNLKLAYFNDFYTAFMNDRNVYLNKLGKTIDKEIRVSNKININGSIVNYYQNDIKLLAQEIKNNKKNHYYLCANNEEHKRMLIETLGYNGLTIKDVDFITDENAISFAFSSGLVFIEESKIYKKMALKSTKYRSTYQNTESINSKDDIKPGDYVVHYDYGIGRYNGIKTINFNDIANDYLSITYGNMDICIPVDKINLLEKYQTEEGFAPKLTNIGTGEWEKKKSKIKEKIENIARDLILLQAVRETKKGYKYDSDDEIQESFENDFEFVETKDQLDAINSIKKDMEDGKIFDRLVCGDVGYGKTEVAIRVAMKTVLNGKQVAYLAPTTILTRQHYYTFKERMEKYGVKVELINRLVKPKKQKQIVEGLKNGSIDVVIGTHALLNDKIQYKDLGLLIIDEEQRFGVTHKEKIKQYRNNVNVLTLTATPIPRTLQMSIMGVKQMSLIETPPQNRYPIQTYVLERNDAVIREAIYNELARSGQVFYLHNRVKDLELVAKRIQEEVPEARIGIAHGQMGKSELEDTIQDFIDRKYDVLICTTIIETGIDIPNTNTLIIDMSDKLGLAQMYQIRGRVGRSDRVSYAYFMYDKSSILTPEGEARLEAIKEFTSLGSGYKIAVRDLIIRGAGDFLGKEQSGFMDTVGLDLYIKLLDECMNEVKGIKFETTEESNYINNIEISKHVSDEYVNDEEIKIYIHKRIASIETKEDKESVINEFKDRFGEINNELMTYIEKQYLDSLANKYGIERIDLNDFKVNVVFSKEQSKTINGTDIMKIVFKMGEDYSIQYRNSKFVIQINRITNWNTWIKNLNGIIEELFCKDKAVAKM